MLSYPHRSTAPGASQGGGCLEQAGLLESIFVPANPAQFHNCCCKNRFEFDPGAAGGKLPEGHEEETPTSAPKGQTFRQPRREGSGRASSRVRFHLKTQLDAQNMS